MKKCVLLAGVVGLSVGSAQAEPVTWSIDQPWEFYTSNTPPQTNLVGTITWDRDVSTYYPASWRFTLVHFDPVFTPHYPVVIEGSFPSLSDASGVAWSFSRDPFTVLGLRFGFGQAIVDVLLNGTQDTVAFGASEYFQVGPFSSQRGINNGVMRLVPTPASAALLGLGGLAVSRRRR